MKVRNVKVNSLAYVFTDSTLSTFTQSAISKGITDDSIIYIVCGSSDAAIYGSLYVEGSHWIWAKGEIFCGDNDIYIPEFTSESDVEQLVPLLPKMITDIVNGDYELIDLTMFTGTSQYESMNSEDVHLMIEEIFTESNSEEIEE